MNAKDIIKLAAPGLGKDLSYSATGKRGTYGVPQTEKSIRQRPKYTGPRGTYEAPTKPLSSDPNWKPGWTPMGLATELTGPKKPKNTYAGAYGLPTSKTLVAQSKTTPPAGIGSNKPKDKAVATEASAPKKKARTRSRAGGTFKKPKAIIFSDKTKQQQTSAGGGGKTWMEALDTFNREQEVRKGLAPGSLGYGKPKKTVKIWDTKSPASKTVLSPAKTTTRRYKRKSPAPIVLAKN